MTSNIDSCVLYYYRWPLMSNGYPLWPIAEDPMETALLPFLSIFFHSSSRPHLGLASRIIISLDTSRYLLEVHKKPQNLHSTWETGSDACPALSDLPSLCWCLVKHHTGSVAHQTDGQQFFLSRITHISGEILSGTYCFLEITVGTGEGGVPNMFFLLFLWWCFPACFIFCLLK